MCLLLTSKVLVAPLPTPPTQPPATHHLPSWGSMPISLYTELGL